LPAICYAGRAKQWQISKGIVAYSPLHIPEKPPGFPHLPDIFVEPPGSVALANRVLLSEN
jgi:hypothetical protein